MTTCYECIYCDDHEERCNRTGWAIEDCDPKMCDVGISVSEEDDE